MSIFQIKMIKFSPGKNLQILDVIIRKVIHETINYLFKKINVQDWKTPTNCA